MTEEEIQNRLAENIRTFRKSKKLTQETLAEMAEVSPETIKSIELRRHWPGQKILAAIATALNVDVYQLFLPVPSSFQIDSAIKDQILTTARTAYTQFLDTVKDSL